MISLPQLLRTNNPEESLQCAVVLIRERDVGCWRGGGANGDPVRPGKIRRGLDGVNQIAHALPP